jgi:hypothetical protein
MALLLTHASYSFGLEAMVKAFKAPLFKQPDQNSQVISYKYKGDVIFIHDENRLSDNIDFKVEIEQVEDTKASSSEFIKTVDSRGNLVYIKRNHLIIYHENLSEIEQALLEKETIFDEKQTDETDYRTNEKIPEDYPFIIQKEQGLIAQLHFILGKQLRDNYPYNESVVSREYSNLLGLQFNLGKNLSERTHIGLGIIFSNHKNDFTLIDRKATENEITFGLGPMFKYSFHTNDDARYSFNLSLLLTRRSVAIKQIGPNGTDSATFSSFVPAFSIQPMYESKNAVLDFDLVFGLQFFTFFPHTLKRSGGSNEDATFWNSLDSDQIEHKALFEVSFFTGLQKVY